MCPQHSLVYLVVDPLSILFVERHLIVLRVPSLDVGDPLGNALILCLIIECQKKLSGDEKQELILDEGDRKKHP